MDWIILNLKSYRHQSRFNTRFFVLGNCSFNTEVVSVSKYVMYEGHRLNCCSESFQDAQNNVRKCMPQT